MISKEALESFKAFLQTSFPSLVATFDIAASLLDKPGVQVQVLTLSLVGESPKVLIALNEDDRIKRFGIKENSLDVFYTASNVIATRIRFNHEEKRYMVLRGQDVDPVAIAFHDSFVKSFSEILKNSLTKEED